MHPSRRTLLRNLAAASVFGGTGLASLSRLATATAQDSSTDHNFIFCYYSGGWDVLLGLDPRDPDEFRDDRISETLIQPGYELLEDVAQTPLASAVPGMHFGPYIGSLIDWACVTHCISVYNRISCLPLLIKHFHLRPHNSDASRTAIAAI